MQQIDDKDASIVDKGGQVGGEKSAVMLPAKDATQKPIYYS